MAEFTPMMQQYLQTKEEYKDCILFYRLGDFYEMFFESNRPTDVLQFYEYFSVGLICFPLELE